MKKIIIFPLALLFLDRLSKWFFLGRTDFYSFWFGELKLVKNFSFYFLNLSRFGGFLLTAGMGMVILLFLELFLRGIKTDNFYLSQGSALIILGGASNLFDRIFFSCAVDWIRIFILPASTFNMADIMIFAGLVFIVFSIIKR